MCRYVTRIITEIQKHSALHTKRHGSGNKVLLYLNVLNSINDYIYFCQVVFEDAIKPLDFSGYGDLVKILPYREVIRLGEMSSKTGLLPKPEDTAIVMYTSGSTGYLLYIQYSILIFYFC